MRAQYVSSSHGAPGWWLDMDAPKVWIVSSILDTEMTRRLAWLDADMAKLPLRMAVENACKYFPQTIARIRLYNASPDEAKLCEFFAELLTRRLRDVWCAPIVVEPDGTIVEDR